MKNYDPSQIVITFRGRRITGFADGTFVKVERNEATFSTKTGADGETTRVRSRNKTGKITITLQAESPSNDDLSTAMQLDEDFGTGTGAVMVKNLNGSSLYSGQVAWVTKPADGEYAKDASNREWMIEIEKLKPFTGGANA